LPAESLLCRAAAELKQAQALRPHAARPWWYLHITWRQLGQRDPACRSLWQASQRDPLSDLTPAEQRDLHLACQSPR